MFFLHILLGSFVALQLVCCVKKKKPKVVAPPPKPKNRYESRVCFKDRNVNVKVDDSFLTSGYVPVEKPSQEKSDPESKRAKKPTQPPSQAHTAVHQDIKQGSSLPLTAIAQDTNSVGQSIGHSPPVLGKDKNK